MLSNGNFEDYTTLPTTQGQLQFTTGWDQVVLSADYLHTTYNGWSSQTGGSYSGDGYIGFASYGDAGGSCESAGQDISANPLVSGVGYSLDLFAKRSPTGSYSDICGGVALYGFNTTPAMGLIADHPINMAGSILLHTTSTITSDLWEERFGCFTVPSTINYVVFCIEFSPNCAQYVYLDSVTISESNSALDLGPDQTLCEGDSYDIDLTSANTTYLWQDGSTGPIMTVTQSGTYWVEVTNACGVSSDTIDFTFTQGTNVDLGPDVFLCNGDVVNYNLDPVNGPYTWQDGTISDNYDITIPGVYWVTTTTGCGSSDTVEVFASTNFSLGPDQTLCVADSFIIDMTSPNTTYLWQDGSTGPTMNVNQSGVYWLQVTNSCGVSSDSVIVDFIPDLAINLGNDINLCPGESTSINLNPNSGPYTWQDGTISNSYFIDTAGIYWVDASNMCSSSSDTIEVFIMGCEEPEPPVLVMPNVFTPNSDGTNDVFESIQFSGFSFAELTIVNRWGLTILESNDLLLGWDGTSNGNQCSEGTYFWLVHGVDLLGNDISLHGFVQLEY